MELLKESLDNFDWQLFADWYRIFMATVAQQQTCYNIAYRKYNALGGETQQLADAARLLTDQIAVVEAQLPKGCKLNQAPGPRFWQANDLVFLLGGREMPPSKRYDDNGQYAPQSNLLCRLENQYITAATANQVTVTAANFADCAADPERTAGFRHFQQPAVRGTDP